MEGKGKFPIAGKFQEFNHVFSKSGKFFKDAENLRIGADFQRWIDVSVAPVLGEDANVPPTRQPLIASRKHCERVTAKPGFVVSQMEHTEESREPVAQCRRKAFSGHGRK